MSQQQWLKIRIPETPKPPVEKKVDQESKVSLANLPSKSLGVKGRRKGRRVVKRGRAKKSGTRTEEHLDVPRDLNTNAVVGQTLRFAVSSDFSGAVSLGAVLAACGGIGTVVNTTLTCWASSLRIRRLRIFPPAEASSIRSQLNSVQWTSNSSLAESKDIVRDASMPYGISVGTVVSSRPPAQSLTSLWLNPQVLSTSTPLFLLTAEQGAIVELDISFTLANALNTTGVTVATAAVGTAYYGYLDGATTHQLKPVGRPSTF